MFAFSVDDLVLDRDRYDEQLDQVSSPLRRYAYPSDVLADRSLRDGEKRAILSAWASDANAVESAPSLRRAPFALRTVTIDEVMDALNQLDGEPLALAA